MTMRPRSTRPAYLACLFLLGYTIACSDADDDTVVRPLLGDGSPAIPIPLVRLDPDFASYSSLARQARGFVMGQLNRVRYIAREAATSMPILNRSGWMEASGPCRFLQIGESEPGNCICTIFVCASEGGYAWEQVLDGPCGLSREGTATYDHWTRFLGYSSEDATEGEFTLYASGTSTAIQSWSWRTDAERAVVDWWFYAGTPRPENLTATLRVDGRTADRWQAELVWDASSKWNADIALDGRSGRMTVLAFSRIRNDWIPQQEVSWVPAHGSWTYYDSAGEPIEILTW